MLVGVDCEWVSETGWNGSNTVFCESGVGEDVDHVVFCGDFCEVPRGIIGSSNHDGIANCASGARSFLKAPYGSLGAKTWGTGAISFLNRGTAGLTNGFFFFTTCAFACDRWTCCICCANGSSTSSLWTFILGSWKKKKSTGCPVYIQGMIRKRKANKSSRRTPQ